MEMTAKTSQNSNSNVAVTPWQRPKMTWAELKNHVWDIRKHLLNLLGGNGLPHSFLFNHHEYIFFLCRVGESGSSLFTVDVPTAKNTPGSIDCDFSLPWEELIPAEFQGRIHQQRGQVGVNLQMPVIPRGISWYDLIAAHPSVDMFLLESSSTPLSLYWCDTKNYPLTPIEIKTGKCSGPRLTAEICQKDCCLIAYVNGSDLWVFHTGSGSEKNVTSAKNIRNSTEIKKPTGKLVCAGYPTSVMREAFNRQHGFWWQPDNDEFENNVTHRILYEELGYRDVNQITFTTTEESVGHSLCRFPFAGSSNPTSTLKLVEFELDGDSIINVAQYELIYSIKSLFPWAEYIVRVEWTEDEKFFYAQLMDRQQQRLVLVLFPLIPGRALFDLRNKVGRKRNRTNSFQWPSAPAYVIALEESTSWINVHDVLAFIFLPSKNNPKTVTFLWGSAESGYLHLYLIKTELRPALHAEWWTKTELDTANAFNLTPILLEKTPLTSGNWVVLGISYYNYYGHGKDFCFFTALKDSQLECHLYVVSIKAPNKIKRLTQMGYSYNVSQDQKWGGSWVVLTYSNIKESPICRLYRVKYNGLDVDGISLEFILRLSKPYGNPKTEMELSLLSSPELFTHELASGETLYGILYKPTDFQEDKCYPTVLHVCKGPGFQTIWNSFEVNEDSQSVSYLLASVGYCVISVDTRGTQNRGVEFAAHIKGKLGTVELNDQVDVIRSLASQKKFINMNRVGIYGCSYGGYVALMGLIQYPKIFKVAVACSPITNWELHNPAIAERYMGLPDQNRIGYQQSSVLSNIRRFPDEEDRLLVTHRESDDNVHIRHTLELVKNLVAHQKPHQLQIFPGEGHSVGRKGEKSSEHFEMMLLSFLQRRL